MALRSAAALVTICSGANVFFGIFRFLSVFQSLVSTGTEIPGRAKTNDIDRDDAPILKAINGDNAVAGYNNVFIDRGTELARVDGVKRTSL